MNNFFDFDNIPYSTVDVSAQSGHMTANMCPFNDHQVIPDRDTLGLAITDGVLGMTTYPNTDNQIPWSATGFFWCADETEWIGAQAVPIIYPSLIQDAETQWQMPLHPEVLNADFHPSSSSLAGALGRGTGPHTDHTNQVGRYDSHSGASVCARDKNEAGPSGESHTIPDEQALITLPAPQTFGQAAKSDADEASTLTGGHQGTRPRRRRHSRKSRITLQAVMKDLKHELGENWGCKPTRGSSITEVEALRGALSKIVLAGQLPIHTKAILTSHPVEQQPGPARERTKRARREQTKRDDVLGLLKELSRYIPWPTPTRQGPHQHLVVQKTLEMLQGLPTRGLANGT